LRALKKAGAYEHRYARPIKERILEKTTPGQGGCIIWTGSTSDGYGVLYINDVGRVAHRLLYEILVGPVPDGLELDHTCHTEALDCPGGQCIHRRCINPNHMEAVTPAINKLRGRSPIAANAFKTHCPHGHEYSEENTYRKANGQRICRECRRVQSRTSYVERPRVRKERTHCRNGHLLDGYTDSNGALRCRECRKDDYRRYKERRRQRREDPGTLNA
jgi:hypothetical protein